ncbi:hypothetical protein [Pseudoalteromonas sp. KS88]|uniref:hypothetical protein n=1 Tax=Pseudoalteromonas sp. KS88 TaxID=2109918 RepID=UPI001436AFC4|nr:hypothetical protein [Pseudoalteromonas sp. KS88]
MFKHTSIALAISASFLVTACLEVEDNNEHYVSSTFNEQTGTYSVARAVGLNRLL